MSKNNPAPKPRQQPLLTFALIFICGFIAGVGFSALKMAPGGGSNQQTSVENQQSNTAITNLEAQVTTNPEDFQAWVQLGNLYFDTEQYSKAIGAYSTSLKYHSGDANLLTDLGVAYRRTQQPEKAIENFQKAQAMDATHQQSRFNEGIVRHYDLKDTPGAIKAWEAVLQINPEASSGGQKLREFVDQLKSEVNKQ